MLLPLAHALEGKQDLPIPEWLFAWGASLVLIVSFVGLSILWREPRFEAVRWRALGEGLSRTLVSRGAEIAAGAIGVFLLGVTVWAGLYGTEAPDRNFSVTFVFVTVWLGFVVFSVLLGDVFRAFNPWRAIARAASSGFRLVAGQTRRRRCRTRTGSAAGPPRSGCSPSCGSSWSTARAASRASV